jgi:hypothetical protein
LIPSLALTLAGILDQRGVIGRLSHLRKRRTVQCGLAGLGANLDHDVTAIRDSRAVARKHGLLLSTLFNRPRRYHATLVSSLNERNQSKPVLVVEFAN